MKVKNEMNFDDKVNIILSVLDNLEGQSFTTVNFEKAAIKILEMLGENCSCLTNKECNDLLRAKYDDEMQRAYEITLSRRNNKLFCNNLLLI